MYFQKELTVVDEVNRSSENEGASDFFWRAELVATLLSTLAKAMMMRSMKVKLFYKSRDVAVQSTSIT